MFISKDTLLTAGVRNLKEFGYLTVSKENIMTDYIYRKFFVRMLEDTIEKIPNCMQAIALKAAIDAQGDKR